MSPWIRRCIALAAGLWLGQAFADTAVGFSVLQVADTRGTQRPLELALWYPADPIACPPDKATVVAGGRIFDGVPACVDAPPLPGPRTAVLLSHGAFGHWGNLAWLAHALARQGRVVAAPNHPGTSLRDRRPDDMGALWLRPTDLSRSLDALLQHPTWAGAVAPEGAVVVGHSLGGWTALVLAGATFSTQRFRADCAEQATGFASCTLWRGLAVEQQAGHAQRLDSMTADPRIAAAVLLDSGLMRGFTPESLGRMKTPVLLIAAGQPDPVQPQAMETGAIATRLPPATSEHQVLPGATHFSFMGLCRPEGAALVVHEAPPDGLMCLDGPGASRAGLHQQTVDAINGFLAKHLPMR